MTAREMSDQQIIDYLRKLAFDRGRDNMGCSDAVLEEAARRLENVSGATPGAKT